MSIYDGPTITTADFRRDAQARDERARFERHGGRAVSARNATSHGVFARNIVLPHLGEDPAAYDALLLQLCAQIAPQNLLEQHYTEQIAAASWRLRRLQRWQAQLYEDPDLTEDQRLAKLDRVLRHETTLFRQIDRAVRMIGRELAHMFDSRTRQQVLAAMDATEAQCAADPDLASDVECRARAERPADPLPPGLDLACLDTAAPADSQNCQNELGETQNCQNETAALTPNGLDPNDLAHDVNDLHPDGRPVYLPAPVWLRLRLLRANDQSAAADRHDAYYRQCFLTHQRRHHPTLLPPPLTKGRAGVGSSATAEGSPAEPIVTVQPPLPHREGSAKRGVGS